MTTITVKYLNGDGGGLPENVQVPFGTTYKDFFNLSKPGQDEAQFKIRVRKDGVTKDVAGGDLVEDGVKISISPLNVKGG